MHWAYLAVAILAEVIGSAALKASDGFARGGPTVLALGAFAAALFFLSLALRVLPLGVAYAIWAGTGTAVVAALGVVVFRQSLDASAVLGIAMIVGGVILINVCSSAAHS